MSQDNKKEIHLQPDLPEQGIEFAHRRQVIRGWPVSGCVNPEQWCGCCKFQQPPDVPGSGRQGTTGLRHWHSAAVLAYGESGSPIPIQTGKSCGTYAQSNGGGAIQLPVTDIHTIIIPITLVRTGRQSSPVARRAMRLRRPVQPLLW